MVIGTTWEVEEIRMTKHLFYPPIIRKPKGIDIERPNHKSADILNDKAKALLLSLNHTIPHPCKSQDWKKKARGGSSLFTYFTLESQRTRASVYKEGVLVKPKGNEPLSWGNSLF